MSGTERQCLHCYKAPAVTALYCETCLGRAKAQLGSYGIANTIVRDPPHPQALKSMSVAKPIAQSIKESLAKKAEEWPLRLQQTDEEGVVWDLGFEEAGAPGDGFVDWWVTPLAWLQAPKLVDCKGAYGHRSMGLAAAKRAAQDVIVGPSLQLAANWTKTGNHYVATPLSANNNAKLCVYDPIIIAQGSLWDSTAEACRVIGAYQRPTAAKSYTFEVLHHDINGFPQLFIGCALSKRSAMAACFALWLGGSQWRKK